MKLFSTQPSLSLSGADSARSGTCRLDYELLDSGIDTEGLSYKIERFGLIFIERPARLACWQPKSPELRRDVTAKFVPHDGWSFPRGEPREPTITYGDLVLRLLFQENGQIGIFPEHAHYFEHIHNSISEQLRAGSIPALLNLFGYTGLLTTAAAAWGAKVTHVDIAKHALSMTKENLECNNLINSGTRIINDDALVFVQRELKRGSKYEIIVADPPNFSRITNKKSWSLEEIFPTFLQDLVALLTEHGTLVITCHLPEWNHIILANMIRQAVGAKPVEFHQGFLLLGGLATGVLPIPAGSFVCARFNSIVPADV